ncbi:histone-lysine N-methyltransferase SETMAR [Elysia marginata]|uniref:Histone-lysine N-methyltransferase SETMAR n=1 Tax=Elysia marginata TaxID=1093978 RepID=A0AAV4J676_9GAST|nr:histone-lysine N-methyltransferase SETMAR [Elysia marginata]
MAAHLETWSKEEIRAVIRFLNAKSLNPTEIHKELQRIVFDELGYRKVSARWVPKRLIDNHREQRLDISCELLRRSKSSRRVHGHTANAGGDFLGEAIRRKRPGRLTNSVILQHGNATPHTARVTQGWLEKYGWEILPHPPHSPDLAPSDYHLFGPLKHELAGKRFDDDEVLVDYLRKWLQKLDGSFFREGIYSMVRHWQKCVDRLGCYVEK